MKPNPTLTPLSVRCTPSGVERATTNASRRSSEAESLLTALSRLPLTASDPRRGAVVGGVVRTRGRLPPSQESARPSLAVAALPEFARAIAAVSRAPWRVRSEVAGGLTALRADTALATAAWLVRNDSEWRVREAAAGALGAFSQPQSQEILAYVAQSDPHPCPAEKAVFALGRLADSLGARGQPERSGGGSATLPRRGVVRTRGRATVRCRGGAEPPSKQPDRSEAEEARSIMILLDEISLTHPDRSVRLAAEETLR